MNITLLSSFHQELGNCNADELYKIIESLKPDVIFEELPLEIFNTVYEKNYIPASLEAKAIKRYVDFLKTYPNIFERVPQWMVASYLGITPESLSRVRKELVRKK